MQAFVDGESAELTPTEFRLLYQLALDRGRVVTRDELLQKIWGRRETHRDRTVDVFVRRLRDKIDRRASRHTFIQTRYGVGLPIGAGGKRPRVRLFATVVAVLLLAGCGGGGSSSSGGGVLVGAGSTFIFPLISKWIPDYSKKHGVTVTYGPIGSGGGIQQITNRTVDFGASDAPMIRTSCKRARAACRSPGRSPGHRSRTTCPGHRGI